MDKIVRVIVLAVIALCCLSACHLFDEKQEVNTVSVYFNESSVTVFEGSMGSVTLRVEPPDSLAYGNVEYEMGNAEVAAIFRADKRGCEFYGIKKGSTVLTARFMGAGGAEAKIVITVL